jgi:hypothetical protein
MIAPIPCQKIDVTGTFVVSNIAVPSHTFGPDVFVVITIFCEKRLKEITLSNVSNKSFRFFIYFCFLISIRKITRIINKWYKIKLLEIFVLVDSY